MRPEKQLLLDEVKGKMEGTQGFILTRYRAMNPNLASAFRMLLAKAGGELEVVRKRILIKAAEKAGCTLDLDALQGHIGVIFADQDPVQTLKSVFDFKKENNEVLEVLGARFEGRLFSAGDAEALSKLPGKEEMRAQLLGLFEAVPAQTLATFEALLTSVAYCLDNKSQT